MSGNTLLIDGHRYTHRDVLNLLYQLPLAEVKVVKTKHSIAFQGPATFLSNLSTADYEFDGQPSMLEQGLVYIHAQICENAGVAALVLDTNNF